jgi:peptidyl-prolyl cis-trans isomerase C
MQTIPKTGCGSGSCGCGKPADAATPPSATPEQEGWAATGSAKVKEEPAKRAGQNMELREQSAQPPSPLAPKKINGIELVAPLGAEAYTDWLELAHTELLRQEAVALGLLTASTAARAPELTEADRTVIEEMVDAAIQTPQPTAQECERYFEANKAQFVVGGALHVRHILFAVTPGVNVNALAQRAEKALLGLLAKNVPPQQFAQLAGELSNCPSRTQGGDLGWIGPSDCAPELAQALFLQKDVQWGMGVHPRLVHSRYGLHILEVLGRREGQQKTYPQVQERIAAQLTLQSRAKALHQYMRLLVGKAEIEGIEQEGADSPLVQ